MTCSTPIFSQSTQDLPRNDDAACMNGCKDAKKVTKFTNSTAGILALVKPCGIIGSITEMFTCESSSQVFSFLLRTLHEHPRIRYIGYDRACELEPFLQNLKKKGNPGAELLLQQVEFLVDIFHVIRHVNPKCMPLENNDQCQFHPGLQKFAEIHGVNTESAEQVFSWLGKLKQNVRHMSKNKFRFFLEDIICSRNEQLAAKLEYKSRRPT